MTIGGYFELELNVGEEYHQQAIRLNTGRNAFEYILRCKKYQKVYLPLYTCDVMLEPINRLHLEVEYYSIDMDFLPIFDYDRIEQGAAFVYTNYFGVCDNQVKVVMSKAKNVIIDNSQAFYSKPEPGVDTFYSPRKFFGVPDGAYLYTDSLLDEMLERDVSYNRCGHLLGRIDTQPEDLYQLFKTNNLSLRNQPIKRMSFLTESLLRSIDYQKVAIARSTNFEYISEQLGPLNMISLKTSKPIMPLVYPLLLENGNLLKGELISKKIYTATYWPSVMSIALDNSMEYFLADNLLAIPIDQRYNITDMKVIVDTIN